MYRVLRGVEALVGYYGTQEAAYEVARDEALRTGSRYRIDHRVIGGKWEVLMHVQPTQAAWGHALPDGTLV